MTTVYNDEDDYDNDYDDDYHNNDHNNNNTFKTEKFEPMC